MPFFIRTQGRSWRKAIKLIQALEGNDAESIRIVVTNYFAKALINTKEDKKAQRMLHILECFEDSYNQSDKFAPLLISVARAINSENFPPF